eukprot:TRINITY_DN3532_c0_g1_i5.p1 TRINITY_DN3532_c0_g1~~TRINITY_DN3532_c0_g1_i5.p1  ORF type:complete len:325 (-),score=32.47 TRINITY_DN3532_c0_g1_i5:356-1330(-)
MPLKISAIFAEDVDNLFAYNTDIEIVVYKRELGIFYRVCQFIIVLLVLVYGMFFVEEVSRHEYSLGAVVVQVSGSGTGLRDSDESFWDDTDVTNPVHENGALFVATRVVEYRRQKKGYCGDFYSRCNVDEDCKVKQAETCVQGYCFGFNWCNTESKLRINKLDVGDSYLVWLKSQIRYPVLDPITTYSTFTDIEPVLYPKKGANTYSIRDLLALAKPPITLPEIQETGAIMKIDMVWECKIGDQACTPSLSVKRMDYFGPNNQIGYHGVQIPLISRALLRKVISNFTQEVFVLQREWRALSRCSQHERDSFSCQFEGSGIRNDI